MFDSLLSFVLSGTEAERHWRSLRCGGLANPGQVGVQAAQAVLRRVTVTPTLNKLISLAGPTHVEPQAPVSPDGLTAYVLALLHRGGLWNPLPPKHPRHKHFPNSKEAPWVGGVRRASWRGSADSRANFAGRKAWPKPLGLPESEVAPGLGGSGGEGGILQGKFHGENETLGQTL